MGIGAVYLKLPTALLLCECYGLTGNTGVFHNKTLEA